jgi:SP family myo-inositol transporter-like MFS transporter 13
MTLAAVALVDKKGRTFLLRIGTAGVLIALVAGGSLFIRIESRRTDVKGQVEVAARGNTVTLPLSALSLRDGPAGVRPTALSVLYSYGDGDHMATVLSNDPDPVLTIAPDEEHSAAPLRIKRAFYGEVPSERTGWLTTAFLALFIASYAVGPGVVVWLVLSELMPTRIRSVGMGVSLVLNQGASTLIASVFLPVVGNYGYSTMFFFWAACTVVYFLTAAFFLPETKGKTLEEIEVHFEGSGR